MKYWILDVGLCQGDLNRSGADFSNGINKGRGKRKAFDQLQNGLCNIPGAFYSGNHGFNNDAYA